LSANFASSNGRQNFLGRKMRKSGLSAVAMLGFAMLGFVVSGFALKQVFRPSPVNAFV
jgi:hypothetical protein